MKYLTFYADFGKLTLPETGRAVVTTKNGKIICNQTLSKRHHIATLSEFLDIAKSAGYGVAVLPREE
ncbi:hypothetical protein [Pantoea coffeiphila]|uniref:Uncharacterized protein n=1 Tax=Pantoea coffeiphila TaxID=1465635 RepID=A0A2S9I898_9GAMM|nr:hypothetical protein [Pantoea coffeiphila]PRD14001.1 hypothetical protein CQW29_18525 [Pantoea coffeiphila]